MSVLNAILMGLLQGLTEFLPVSSSGHLVIFKLVFGVNTDTGILFDVMLYIGTLGAVFVAFWKDIRQLAIETVRIIYDVIQNIKIFINNRKTGDDDPYRKIVHNNYRKFVMLILVSTIPTGILGFVAQGLVEKAGSSLLFPGIGLLITGILLLVVDFINSGNKIPKDVTYANAMWIGICQGISTFPGISRSGMTICACLLAGLNRKFAVKYSFLMSVPAILGAAVLELKNFGSETMSLGLGFTYLLGMIVAGVVGYFCVKTMLVLVRKKQFRYFAYYCFLIGIIALISNFVM